MWGGGQNRTIAETNMHFLPSRVLSRSFFHSLSQIRRWATTDERCENMLLAYFTHRLMMGIWLSGRSCFTT